MKEYLYFNLKHTILRSFRVDCYEIDGLFEEFCIYFPIELLSPFGMLVVVT